jgi:hypothetical protein
VQYNLDLDTGANLKIKKFFCNFYTKKAFKLKLLVYY